MQRPALDRPAGAGRQRRCIGGAGRQNRLTLAEPFDFGADFGQFICGGHGGHPFWQAD